MIPGTEKARHPRQYPGLPCGRGSYFVAEQTQQHIIDRRRELESNLGGWQEPSGYLVPTEPDIAARAITRIELRIAIDTLTYVLGDRPVDHAATERGNHRDRLRIADDGAEQAGAT